jgi:MFS family permease
MFIMGIGSVGITLIPNQTLISNWFEKYRGRAMGIMMAGIGFGGLLMPPFANLIIERHSWRLSFLVLGLLILTIITPVTLLLVRTRPSDMGLTPDGIIPDMEEAGASDTGGNSGIAGLTVKRAVRTPSFWLLFVAFMLLVFGESGLTVNFVAFVDDAGVPSQAAAFFWGLAAGISSVGRLGFGFLADRWNPRNLIALTHGFHAVGVGILLIFFLGMNIQSAVSLVPFSIIYGLSLGGSAVLLPVLVGRCFGLLNFSKLLGILMSGFALGVIGGPLLAGRIYDTTGSYRLALIIYVIAFAVAALAVALVQPDKQQSDFVRAGADGT